MSSNKQKLEKNETDIKYDVITLHEAWKGNFAKFWQMSNEWQVVLT